jgi:hypothetical protein
MFLWSGWDYLVYGRSLSRHDPAELPGAPSTNELLPPRGVPGLSGPPQSVADQTTRRLDAAGRPPRRSS